MEAVRLQTVAKGYHRVHPLFGWGIGLGLTFLLGALFSWAAFSAHIGALSGLLLIGWAIWAWCYPQLALACLLLVWLTLYQRASLPLLQMEGGWNRGGLSLGDLLWFVFALIWLIQYASTRNGLRFAVGKCSTLFTLLLMLYLGFSVLLPLLGGLVGGWPPSYAIPGLRHLQWASFALFSGWLVRQDGILPTWRLLLTVFTLAGILHALYALLQLLVPLGIAPSEWLLPDQIFAQRFATTWFFYPRTTGLLVNPNSYGLFGAVLLLLLSASLLSRASPGVGKGVLMGIASVWAVATSASRSALVGLAVGLFVIATMSVLQAILKRDEKGILSGIGFVMGLLLITGITLATLWLLLPPHLLNRVALVLSVALEGSAVDPNAIGRLDLWEQGLQAFEERFPFGTWVPAGYALGIPLDSYYVSLLVQGTPLYLGLFLLLLGGIMRLAWRKGFVNKPLMGGAGLALAGVAILIGVASFTLSPLQEPQTLVPFWFLLGVGIASADSKR
jgi:hypothetical protein